MVYICEICGKEYEKTKRWRSVLTCCKECAEKRKSIKSKEYWQKVRDGVNESRRKVVPDGPRIRYKKENHENNISEINELARSQQMTYGQMQGYLYCKAHPMVHKRGIE